MEPWTTRKEKKISKRKCDILSDIMPMYHISKICGLLPVRISLERPGRYKGKVNYPQVGYGIMLLMAITGAQSYGIYLDARDGLEKSTRLFSQALIIVTLSDVMSSLSVVVVMIVGSPFRWRFIQRALNKLVDVDEKLRASPSNFRKLSVILICCSLAYLSCLSIVDYLSWEWTASAKAAAEKREVDSNKGPLNYVPLYLMYVVIVVCELQYAVVLLNIGERFRKLNRVIESLSNCRSIESSMNIVEEAGRDSKRRAMQSVLFDLDEQQHRSNEAADNAQQQAETIDRLITLHGVLCDSVNCVNRAYGGVILAVTLSCLMDLVVTEYFFYDYVHGPVPTEWPLLILQVAWILFHYCRLLIVVQPCHMVAAKSKRTGKLINQASSYDWSPEVKKQLKIFATQLLQRPIQFSACGLFYVDRGLLTSIVGSVTMYLVILVQFKSAADTKGTKNLIEHASALLRNVSRLKKLFSIK